MRRAQGFTLIEVMVAMVVIALGVGALLSALVNSANTVNYLRDKSFAQWIAFNQLSELRLSATTAPAAGVTSDVVEYAGGVWRWEQQVSQAGLGDLWRVSVRVSRLGDVGSTVARRAEGENDELPALGTAIGFLANSVTRPSGLTPDWSPPPPTGPGPGGEGGDR
jgi:general secretion pathway protein I